jgi:hypothetical protein
MDNLVHQRIVDDLGQRLRQQRIPPADGDGRRLPHGQPRVAPGREVAAHGAGKHPTQRRGHCPYVPLRLGALEIGHLLAGHEERRPGGLAGTGAAVQPGVADYRSQVVVADLGDAGDVGGGQQKVRRVEVAVHKEVSRRRAQPGRSCEHQ